MAKAFDKLETVDEFEAAISDLLGEYTVVVKKIGAMVKRASEVLTNERYKELIRRLKNYGWTDSLFEAARAVEEGTLHPELVVVKVPVSKVMTLPKSDQARLIKGEKFPLKQINGPPIEKSWTDMTPDEANQLLGPKGGHIHSPKEQKVKEAVKKQKDHTVFTEARYDRHDRKFSFSHGRRQGEIFLATMIDSLLDKEELDAANAAWQKKMTEMRELIGT